MSAEQLAKWFDTLGPALTLYARQLADAGFAADAVQEAFLRLMRQRRQPEKVNAWLFRTVRNIVLNELRRRRVRTGHAPKVAAAEWFEDCLDDALDGRTVRKAMESLPAAQREVVVMRIWGEMTLAEISAAVAAPVSTVFSRYRAALEAIRQKVVSPCETKRN